MDLPTRLDYFEIGRRYVLTRARRIEQAAVDTEGTDVNLFVGAMSFVAQEISRQLAERIGALFLDGAYGEDLDRYAFDRYQLTRKGASAAVGVARFFRRAAISMPGGSIAIGTKILGLTGVEYVTTTQATFADGDAAQPADVRATQAGGDFQVGRNQLRKFADPTSIFDARIEVTNDEPTAGGDPGEQDDEFRERVRDFWNAARRGTLSAIEFGARTVPGVASAQAIEALDGRARPARVVLLFIADGGGVASAPLARRVDQELLEYRAAGIQVIIGRSMPAIVPIVLRLRFDAGVDTAGLGENVRAAAFEFVNSLPANGTLERLALGAVLQRFRRQGLRADEGTIVEPAGDVVPAPGTTLRTTLADVRLV